MDDVNHVHVEGAKYAIFLMLEFTELLLDRTRVTKDNWAKKKAALLNCRAKLSKWNSVYMRCVIVVVVVAVIVVFGSSLIY